MGVVTSIGTKIETGLVTTCAITVTQAVPIGDSVLVAAGCSRTGVTATCADSRGNTYTPDKNQTGTGSSSFSILSAPVTVALQIGDTITVTFSSANTSSNANMAIAGTHAGLLTIDKTAGALGSSTSWSSGATVTTTQADEVCFGGSFNNASSDGTSTGTNGYTNVAAINDTAVGALGFNLTAVYKTAAATGAQTATGTWSATGASQDTKSAVATYKLPVTSSAPSLVPLRISNPHVGPQALRNQFRRSYTPTSPAAGQIDTIVPGTINSTASVSAVVVRGRALPVATINSSATVTAAVVRARALVPSSVTSTATVTAAVVRNRALTTGSISSTATVTTIIVRFRALPVQPIAAITAITAAVTTSGTAAAAAYQLDETRHILNAHNRY